MEENLKRKCYELYKLDWLKSHISPQMLFAEFCQYLLERAENEDLEEDYNFDEYLFENGFGEGSVYVCFEEFLDAEFMDEAYMKELLKENEELWTAYLKEAGPEEENKDIEGIDPDDYTIECCPFCENEAVIFAKGITACPECGASLAPCSMCEECNYETCPYGCTGGAGDEFKEITNPPISKELAEKLYKLL